MADKDKAKHFGKEAIAAALEGNLEACQETNERWLNESIALGSTRSQEVFNKIGLILTDDGTGTTS